MLFRSGGVAPSADIPTAMRLNELLVAGRTEKIFIAAHDLSQGGLAAAVSEMSLKYGIGAEISLTKPAIELFSETPGRVIVAVKDESALKNLCDKYAIPATKLGHTGGDALKINDAQISLSELRAAYTETLPRLFG